MMATKETTCLLVGGGGFIGTHLAALCATTGRKVVVTGRSPIARFPLPPSVRYEQLVASRPSRLAQLLDEAEEVVDLAYATVPKTSFEDPVFDVMANLPFNVQLLKLASERRLRKFVFVSSGGTVYGNPQYLPIDESHPTNPVSPYGITKLAIEKYGWMYHVLNGLPFLAVRPGNPYGPYQLGGMGQGFIATALQRAKTGGAIQIFGKRGSQRDYIHVTDVASGIVAALEKGRAGATYNIGSGQGRDNRQVLEAIEACVRLDGFSLRVETLPSRPFDVAANVLASDLLHAETGWVASRDFEHGLRDTWEWMKGSQQ